MNDVRKQPVTVSIVVFTHNSERRIRRCLRSIFSQLGHFVYEIVVVDSDSADLTLDIVAEELAGQERGSCRIERGQGWVLSPKPLIELFASLRGEYVAFLRGQDEWVRPTKMHEQIDFLEHHRECYGSVTNYLSAHVKSAQLRARTRQNDEHSLADPSHLIRNNLVWSISSAMFRAELLRDVELCKSPVDHLAWLLALQLSTAGLLGIQHQIMALENDDEDRPEVAQREINRTVLLANLREYDELTKHRFSEDFQALAGALRAEIAQGAEW